MTYGSNRSSKTASNAIANKKRNDMPEFNGIGSLPNVPLQGGLGEIWGGGRKQMGFTWKQPKAGYRGEADDPLAVNYGDLYKRFANKKDTPTPDEFSRRIAVPRVESLDELQVGERGLYGRMQANLASQIGIDPLSEEYAQILLGKRPDAFSLIRGNDPLSGVNLGMVGGTGATIAQPPQADPLMQQRRQMPAQFERMVPGVGGYGGGDFMPVANEGPQAQGQFGPPEGFAPQMVAPPQPQYMPPQYMPPQQMYPPVPQYTQPQPKSVGDQNIYSRLDDMMLAGMNNKTIYDQYRQDDWTRDRAARGWDMFAGGVLNPLASMFVRDPAARNRMMQSGNQQAYRYDNMRQLRNNERQAQFNEDKYYTDMRMANDPNSFENWAKQQELQTSRMNANNGLMSQQGLAQWRMMQDQNADLERQRKTERDSNDFDIRNRQLEAMSAYRQGQLALGDIRNKISQQNANTTASRAASLNSVDAKRQQLMNSQIDKIQQDIEDAVLRGDLNRVKSRLDEINTLRQMYAIDEKGNPKVDAQGFAQAKLPAPKSATAKKAEKKKGLLDGLIPQAKPAQSTQPNPANPIPAKRATAAKPPMSRAELEKLLKAKGLM